jgi:hypothetical protein
MRFAKWVFVAAGVYGLLVIAPMYLLEGAVVRFYGPLTQPVWYYGFVGTALPFQLIYLMIGADPVRFRPMMPITALAKLLFGGAALVLFAMGRAPVGVTATAMPDLVWMVLFVIAYLRTPRSGLVTRL